MLSKGRTSPGIWQKDQSLQVSVDCLTGNSSSRRSSAVTSKLSSRCPPMSPCAYSQTAILCRCRCSVMTLVDLPGDITTFL
ncbi:hypothetical protein TNCV_3141091 [Trichonephila clavipes]|nr:hypothetical protein TNCV_3141091 [Trichonephila clavipes]